MMIATLQTKDRVIDSKILYFIITGFFFKLYMIDLYIKQIILRK